MSRHGHVNPGNGEMIRRVAKLGSPGGAKDNCRGRAFFASPRMKTAAHGFTLLEVMVCLTVLAIGAALTLSLISGSLGNIRKVQQRTRTVEHAEAVMELALLDTSIRQPTAYSGDFEDGTRWSVRIEDYDIPEEPALQPRALPQNMPVKLLCYTVEMFSPGARASDYSLQTLKLVNKTAEDRLMGAQ